MVSSRTGRTPTALPVTSGEEGRGRLLGELRARGARGGVISEHRAMVSGRLTASRLTSMVVVPLLLAGSVTLALGPLGEAWGMALQWLAAFLRLPGEVDFASVSLGSILTFRVPYLTTVAPLPGPTHFLIVGAICAVVLALSFALPDRFLPLRYFLRFAALVQLTTILNFAVRPGTFPYDLLHYTLGFLEAGCAVLVLIPIVLGLTFFPFDIALWRKVALTAMAVAHVAVLLPMQVALHVYVVHHLSLLALPTMFFIWGILIEIFVFVALYGWGMSWPDARRGAPALEHRALAAGGAA